MRHGLAQAVAIAALLAVALTGTAGAYTAAPGFAAQDYATGFAESPADHWGPIGIGFDQSDNLYVADTADGNIFRFQPGGGLASSATLLTQAPIPGHITGLAISRSGSVYVARYQAGDVVQIDPGTGSVVRTVAAVPCATGLAVDPISGDLFVSQNACGSTIWRVSGFANGPGTATPYAAAPGVDGLAFDQDGTLYAESDGNVLRIGGTGSAAPGAITNLAYVPHADGLAFGAHRSGQPPFLVANRNDGKVTQVDFGQGVPSQADIFSGGSRGDFAAVDSRGCLYITQSASIVRVAGVNGSCAFEPSTPGAGSSAPAPRAIVTMLHSSPHRGCTLMRTLKFRVRQQGRVRLRSATVYINGRPVKQLNGAAVTAPIVLSRLPNGSFTLQVITVTTKGKRLVTRQFFSNCAKPAQACIKGGSLAVGVPQSAGSRIVAVDAYVNGRLTKRLRGHAIATITLTHLPRGRFTVKLVTKNARGKRATSSRTFVGCAASSKHGPG